MTASEIITLRKKEYCQAQERIHEAKSGKQREVNLQKRQKVEERERTALEKKAKLQQKKMTMRKQNRAV